MVNLNHNIYYPSPIDEGFQQFIDSMEGIDFEEFEKRLESKDNNETTYEYLRTCGVEFENLFEPQEMDKMLNPKILSIVNGWKVDYHLSNAKVNKISLETFRERAPINFDNNSSCLYKTPYHYRLNINYTGEVLENQRLLIIGEVIDQWYNKTYSLPCQPTKENNFTEYRFTIQTSESNPYSAYCLSLSIYNAQMGKVCTMTSPTFRLLSKKKPLQVLKQKVNDESGVKRKN